MNRRWLIILLGVLGLLMIYEVFNSSFSFTLIIIGITSLLLKNNVSKKRQNIFLIVGVSSLLLALFSSRLILAFLIVGILLFIGENPAVFQLTREVFSKKRSNEQATDFVIVRFDEGQDNPPKITRNKWLGEDTKTEDSIYSWENVNFTKMIGNTVFDLGNTILPKEQNIILIRKGIGNTKILVPEGVAVSLDVSVLLGKVIINQEEVALENETFKWYSKNYQSNARKIKIIANVLVGEVEVIFL